VHFDFPFFCFHHISTPHKKNGKQHILDTQGDAAYTSSPRFDLQVFRMPRTPLGAVVALAGLLGLGFLPYSIPSDSHFEAIIVPNWK
jgi:hypothetical protein